MNKIIIVTGSNGLIGFESCCYYAEKGYKVIGIDNDMRSYFFGINASTKNKKEILLKKFDNYQQYDIDIRDYDKLIDIFKNYGSRISMIIHTAAQPSHDWAAKEPLTDFSVNAIGTLNLLECTRLYCKDAVFIFTSTNKVYGDLPNYLPLIEKEKRWEIDENHKFFNGIDESMSIDNSKHSIFGASKIAADVMVQEYGKYFNMNTCVFRGGCLTGPFHSGAELHGFLSYIIMCAVNNTSYTIFGYKGKQVRDNIHSYDLVLAFDEFYKNPRYGEVYNMGGSRYSNISVLETIDLIEELSGYKLNYTLSNDNRIGDHIWYISDVSKFKNHYPNWNYKYDIKNIILEIIKNK